MKAIKLIGCAGVAAIALPLLISSVVVTEKAQARMVPEDAAGSLVHRVSHALAADAEYTATAIPAGYKWGQKNYASTRKESWVGSEAPISSGYKWTKSNAAVDFSRSVGTSFAEQTANPWGRRDFSEQAANPWGRR